MNESSYFVAEAARLATLASYELVDSDPDPALDALTRTAAAICAMPIALITLYGVDRHRFKSNFGLPGMSEAPLDMAPWNCTVSASSSFEVVDAENDPRFADDPLVTREPRLRAYYGVPLRSREGHVLGTLCVLDRVPRSLDARQRAALEDLAQVSIALFEHRRATLQAQQTADALDYMTSEVLIFDGETTALRYANAAARERLGNGDHTIVSALPGFAHDAVERTVSELLDGTRRDHVLAGNLQLSDGRHRPARVRIERLRSSPPRLFTTAQGGEARLLLDGVPRVDGEDCLHGYIGVAVDVTHHVEQDDAHGATQWRNACAAAGEEVWERSPDWPQLESDVHPADRARVRAALEEHRRGATPRFACEFRILAADGSVRWVVDRGQRMAGNATAPEGRLVGIRQDVTLAHEREEVLQSLTQSLAERTAELHAMAKEFPAFLLAAAHDLRAPLRAVSGYAEVLKQDLPPMTPPRAMTAVSRIIRSAADLDTLLEALLRLSSLSQLPLCMQPTPLDRLVRDAWQELHAERQGRNIELVVHPLPTVACDRGLLTRAFVNLLGNAIKFTALRPAPRIEIGIESLRDGQLTVFVRDNGVGFDAEHAAQLFEPFRRFHNRSDFCGHGMGLAIVQRTVQRHDGRVWARSDPGQGATFYVALPLGELPSRPRRSPQSDSPRSDSPQRREERKEAQRAI